MDIRNRVKSTIKMCGQKLYIKDGSWISTPFTACIQPVRYQNKMYLKNINTGIGASNQKQFLYVGPYDRQLEELSGEAVIIRNNEKFAIIQSENVMSNDKIVYVWAILKRLWEDE